MDEPGRELGLTRPRPAPTDWQPPAVISPEVDRLRRAMEKTARIMEKRAQEDAAFYKDCEPERIPLVQYRDGDGVERSEPAAVWQADEPPESWHGTDGGYTNHGCRLECCKAAHREAHRKARGSETKARIREGTELISARSGTDPGLSVERDSRRVLTVGDVLRAHRRGKPCWFTRPQLLRNLSEQQLRYVMFRCMSGRCTQCAGRWASRALRRWIETWEDAEVWRVHLKPEEAKRALRQIRKEYGGKEKSYGVARQADGSRIVFAPGEIDGGEPVENIGRAVAEALLGTPAHPKDEKRKGPNRTSGIPISKRTVSEWESVLKGRLAKLRHWEVQDLANRIARALGKGFLKDDDDWTVATFSASLRKLSEEEFEIVDGVLENYLAERTEWDEIADFYGAKLAEEAAA
jgi:hypothetical protein